MSNGNTDTISSSDALTNFVESPDYSPVVPDTSGVDLPGQLPSTPGGAVAFGPFPGQGGVDPVGINQIYLDAKINPTPTANYMPIAAQLLQLAQQSMKTFASGSPSPAIPGPRRPLQTTSPFINPTTGGTNYMMVGLVVIVGVGVLVALAYWV